MSDGILLKQRGLRLLPLVCVKAPSRSPLLRSLKQVPPQDLQADKWCKERRSAGGDIGLLVLRRVPGEEEASQW